MFIFLVSIMEQEQCNGCSHQNDCQNIFQRLSNAKGPSILSGTILAMLLPLIIFIVTAASCEKLLADLIQNQLIVVLLSILSGIIVTLVYIMIFKIATKTQRHKEK
jgi:hypothetical protein